MTEESKAKLDKKERIEELKKKVGTKAKIDSQEFGKQLTTRSKLERDYKEDNLYVTFKSSKETERTVLARKPNQDEFLSILSLSVEAAKYEGKIDPKSLEKMRDIYAGMHVMAANLSLDKTLDEEFWSTCISFSTLQSFITNLIQEFQKGSNIPESEIKSFR